MFSYAEKIEMYLRIAAHAGVIMATTKYVFG